MAMQTLQRTKLAEAAMRIAKRAYTDAAKAVLNHEPDAAELGDRARILLRRAESLRQLAGQDKQPPTNEEDSPCSQNQQQPYRSTTKC